MSIVEASVLDARVTIDGEVHNVHPDVVRLFLNRSRRLTKCIWTLEGIGDGLYEDPARIARETLKDNA